MGSLGVAAWIAQITFWVFLALGLILGEVKARGALFFVALWLFGYMALPRILPDGGLFVTPYLAVLDIILVLIVYKGNLALW